MTNRTGDLRPDYTGHRDFLMAQPTRDLGDKHERIAESLLLNWPTHADPNILGLRRVDESKHGQKLAMVHIAIPLDYNVMKLKALTGQSALRLPRLRSCFLDHPTHSMFTSTTRNSPGTPGKTSTMSQTRERRGWAAKLRSQQQRIHRARKELGRSPGWYRRAQWPRLFRRMHFCRSNLPMRRRK